MHTLGEIGKWLERFVNSSGRALYFKLSNSIHFIDRQLVIDFEQSTRNKHETTDTTFMLDGHQDNSFTKRS